jgi:hypothetical protein
MNCIANPPSLFLQRIYSENSLQNCDATRSARCARRTAFAASHYPMPTSIAHRRSVPNSPSVEYALGRWRFSGRHVLALVLTMNSVARHIWRKYYLFCGRGGERKSCLPYHQAGRQAMIVPRRGPRFVERTAVGLLLTLSLLLVSAAPANASRAS